MRAYRACMAGLLSLGLFFLSACSDGDDATTPLPASLAIQAPASIDVGATTQFSADVADRDGLKFSWDFGDGTSSTEASPSHVFASPGEYEVVLTLSNGDGESRTASFKISAGRFAMVKGLTCSAGDSHGWCWQRPQPTGNEMQDMAFVDATTGWAVGHSGQILKTVDAGATWLPQESHVSVRLKYVRFANASVGWVLGNDGTILKTSDAGATWQQQAALLGHSGEPGDPGLIVLDENRVLAIADQYSVRATTDGGVSWTNALLDVVNEVTSDGTLWERQFSTLRKSGGMGTAVPTLSYEAQPNQTIQQFSMGTPRDGLMAVYDWDITSQRILRTSDAGASWQPAASIGLQTETVSFLKSFGPSAAWAVTEQGLYRSIDAGGTWNPISLPPDVDPTIVRYDAHAQDEQTFWFQYGGGYYLSTDGGVHWTWLHAEDGPDSAHELKLNAGGLWLTYAGERVHHSKDGGASWTQAFGMPAGQAAEDLGAVWFFNDQSGLALSVDGWLLKTVDGGRAWTRALRMSESSATHPKLQFVSASMGWMSGSAGISWTTDGGSSWYSPADSGGLTDPIDFHFVDADHGWAISANQALFHTADGGKSWQYAGVVYGKSAVRFINDRVGVVAGSSGSVLRTEDGGVTWSARPTGVFDNLSRLVFVDELIGWAVGVEGTVVTTSDAGLTWHQVPVPTSAWLNDVFFVDALHGWIVGDQGTVLATVDGGRTWSVEASRAEQSLRSAFFLDAYTGWIVGSHGAVLATATGGR